MLNEDVWKVYAVDFFLDAEFVFVEKLSVGIHENVLLNGVYEGEYAEDDKELLDFSLFRYLSVILFIVFMVENVVIISIKFCIKGIAPNQPKFPNPPQKPPNAGIGITAA